MAGIANGFGTDTLAVAATAERRGATGATATREAKRRPARRRVGRNIVGWGFCVVGGGKLVVVVGDGEAEK